MKRSSRARRTLPALGADAAAPLGKQLQEISRGLASSLDINATVELLLRACARAVGSRRALAYLLQPDGHLAFHGSLGLARGVEKGAVERFSHEAWLRGVLDGGEPRTLSLALAGTEEERDLLAAARAQSLLVVPLVLGKDHFGVLLFLSERESLAEPLGLFTPGVLLELGQAVALARAISYSASSEQRFHHLVQSLTAIVWEADAATWQFTFVSRRAEEILGYPVEQWLREPDFWVQHIHRDDRKRTAAECRRAIAEGRNHELEYRALPADGREVWLRDIVRLVRDDEGRVTQLRGLMVDVTEIKQAQRVLEQRTTYLRALIENLPLAVVVLDARHRVEMCNAAFERLFQYSPAEITGTSLDELIAPPAQAEEAAGLTLQVLSGTPVKTLAQRRRKDGTLLDVELYGVPLLIGGQLAGVYAIYQDVTERKRAEAALRESEAKFRAVSETAACAIFISRGERLLYVNRAAVTGTGYTADELLRMNTWDLVHPASRRQIEEMRAARQRGDPVPSSAEFKILTKSGEERWVEYTGATIDYEGQPAVLGTAFDVTERRELEATLRQVQKMEAVGRLAGGVAHDFNNLLMVIRGHSELLLDRLGAEDPLRRHTVEIDKAAQRAAALTHQLLAFSRKQMLQPRVLDLNAVIGDLEMMLRRLIVENIELATELEPGLGRVKADPGQMEQVILNLVVNARDALPRGGQLVVKTANVELDAAFVRQHRGARKGSYVMLAVRDNGVGMDAETQAHVFEPFFTTKAKGKGTGLGLATVYGIVKQSDGYIAVDSAPGEGTTFSVYLKRVEEPVPAAPEEAVEEAPEGGAETVLVVEDEEPLRRLVCDFLASNGYQVLEARNGAEALERVQAHRGELHLLLTDVVMPGMSGRELAQELQRRRPETGVLYVSGYADAAPLLPGTPEAQGPLLQKPFTLATLAQQVREALRERRGR